MNKEQLRQKAKAAIDRWEHPTLVKLPGDPVIQFAQPKPLPNNFPIAFNYLGCNSKGLHVYNFNARSVLQYLDRHDAEF